MNIYPAILTDEKDVIAEQLGKVLTEEDLEVIQFDLIDGSFADNITVTPADLTSFDFQDRKIDLHLMVDEPLDYLFEAKDYTNLPIRATIGQVEHMSSQIDFLRESRNQEWLPGLSLDLYTPMSAIEPESWEYMRILQIMGIEAGFQAQKLNFSALEKVKAAAEYIKTNDLQIELIVDGGIKLDNVTAVASAGADGVAIGSGLWQAADFSQALDQYQSSSQERLYD